MLVALLESQPFSQNSNKPPFFRQSKRTELRRRAEKIRTAPDINPTYSETQFPTDRGMSQVWRGAVSGNAGTGWLSCWPCPTSPASLPQIEQGDSRTRIVGGKETMNYWDLEAARFALEQSLPWLKINADTGLLSGVPDRSGKSPLS
jgi:hypothetical protein